MRIFYKSLFTPMGYTPQKYNVKTKIQYAVMNLCYDM